MAYDIEKAIKLNSRAPGLKRSAWIEKLQPASFRGVEFFVDSVQNEFGRRIVTHEFPKRDNATNQDLGRKARKFSFSAYIVGDDYFSHRNQLIKALEEPGPGKLVHPYLGIFQVVALEPKSTETITEGRVCRFDLEFVEDKVDTLTVQVLNTKNDNYTKRQNFRDMVNTEFASSFNLVDKALSDVNKVVSAIDDFIYLLLQTKQVVSSVSAFKGILNNIRGKIIEIIYDSEALADELSSAVLFGTDVKDTTFSLTPVDARLQFSEMQNTIDSLKLNLAELTTDNSDYEIYNFSLKCCLVAMSGLVSIMEYDSRQDGEEVRNTLFKLLDEVLFEGGISDDLFSAINDMKASINIDLDRRLDSLGDLFEYPITDQSMNSLAITYSIYGNLDKEQEILSRNKIANPFFISGPDPLQVVVNV